jgi:O-methyltransferase domain
MAEQSQAARAPGAAHEPFPGMVLYQHAIGHYMARALALVAKLNIADQLAAGACTSEQLAKATQSDAAALRRVLRLVASIGTFEEDGEGRFRLTPIGELLRSDAGGSMRAMVLVFAGESIQDSWKELEFCVRTGLPAFKKHDPDADAFKAISADPEAAANFDKAMATFAPQMSAAVTAAYDFSRFGTLVDVGGGNGSLLRGILSANAKLRGVLFDQPHVTERARPALQASDVGARLELASGSFFESVPSGCDAYLLKHVIHDWNDTDAGRILDVCRKAMPAHAKLLLVEGVYPARITRSPEAQGAASNDVNMLVCTGGRQRTEAEFRELLHRAGFELLRIIPTESRISIVEAEQASAHRS